MKAVFLDRDGTINVDTGYIHKVKDFKFIPGSVDALKILSEKYKLIVVTNQSGISRGIYTVEDMNKVNEHMIKELGRAGVRLAGIYHCPHQKEDNCSCRKPRIGMIERAREELGIEPWESYMVGDATSDIKAGKDAGCTTILVRTGKAGGDGKCIVEPDLVANDLLGAANRIGVMENKDSGQV